MGNITSCMLTYQNFENQLQTTIVIIIIITLLTVVYWGLPIEQINKKIFYCKSRTFDANSQKTLMEMEYKKTRETFLMQFQDYNQVYRYKEQHLRKQQTNDSCVKAVDQINHISKTLARSIQERVSSHNSPVIHAMLNPIHNSIHNTYEIEEDQIGDIYFEYQQKIHMKKTQPKVKIPPLHVLKGQTSNMKNSQHIHQQVDITLLNKHISINKIPLHNIRKQINSKHMNK